jgi:hypothetical protein
MEWKSKLLQKVGEIFALTDALDHLMVSVVPETATLVQLEFLYVHIRIALCIFMLAGECKFFLNGPPKGFSWWIPLGWLLSDLGEPFSQNADDQLFPLYVLRLLVLVGWVCRAFDAQQEHSEEIARQNRIKQEAGQPLEVDPATHHNGAMAVVASVLLWFVATKSRVLSVDTTFHERSLAAILVESVTLRDAFTMPQFYVNFRLWSVKHLPWRVIHCRVLLMFIDSIFQGHDSILFRGYRYDFLRQETFGVTSCLLKLLM